MAGTDNASGPLRVTCVLGARPEAIKLEPIVLAGRETPERFAMTVIATDQHRQMVSGGAIPYGDGRASERILNFLLTHVGVRSASNAVPGRV